jgi:hypothetical protein
MSKGESKVLLIQQPVLIKVLAAQLQLRPPQIMKELMDHGIFASMHAAIPRAVAESILRAHGVRYSFIAD